MIKAILKIKITHRSQIIRMISNKDRKSRVSKKIKNNLSFFDYLNISEEKFVEPKDFTDYFNIC